MTIKSRVRPFLLIACFVTGFCPVHSHANSGSDKLVAEDDIREVVLRYEMQAWYREADQGEKEAKTESDKAIAKELNFKIFFVSINDKDPNEAFIKRFRDIPRLVKKASDSEIGKHWRQPVVDKATGQRGIIFRADEIHWLNKDSVEVKGGYFCDGLCGLGETFKVKRSKDRWIVKGTVVRWIS